MRISSPAVRTLLVSGLLGALAFTTTGCQDDTAKPEKPAASSPAATPSASASATPSPTPSASPSPSAPAAKPATPPPPKAPPKPKTNGPSLPPPMNDGGGNGGGDSGGSGSGGSVYYKNCAAVRAAGAAPLHRGDPGYAAHLDRDGDGIACEK
ncbi:excalibur calcium-binding domain-containing protein [Streptomyces violascens]|uniref:excalibur calcium-binding domain-containing protein n=1 Tax=Streptomyces violascens TaxID=67381 RepID=UPI003647B0C2